MAIKQLDDANAPAKLRAARAALDESQRVFSERLGISPDWLAQLEGGERTPSLKLAVLIEELTGIASSEWLNERKAAVA